QDRRDPIRACPDRIQGRRDPIGPRSDPIQAHRARGTKKSEPPGPVSYPGRSKGERFARPGSRGGPASIHLQREGTKRYPMSTTTPRATVRHTPLTRKKVPDALAEVDTVCGAGSGCTLVQNDPVASQALLALQKALASTQGSLTKRLAAAQALA